MKKPQTFLEFTGEYFVPGKSGQRIEDDHFERYRFATRYARGSSILDIACGAGYAAPMLIQAGAASYDGSDINRELVAYASQRYGSDAVRYFQGDICTFDQGRKYDLIICFETIEHVPEYQRALTNLHGLLRGGGLLMISSPNRLITSPGSRLLSDKPTNEFHTQEFVPSELILALRQAGFSATEGDLFGQRQRLSALNSLRRFMPSISSRLSRIADRWASPMPSRMRISHDSRYFIALATKKAR